MKNKFFFVRHAETIGNQQKLCQGQRDTLLSEKGYKQAKLLAQSLRDFPIDCIVSSPLSRALLTAKEIGHFHPSAEFHTVKELEERDWGMLEGMSSEEMYHIERLEEKDPFYTPGKKVEERTLFRKRVEQGILMAQSYHPHPLVVSHGRVFFEICLILKIPPIRQIPNCQLVELTPVEESWHLSFVG